MDYRYTVIEADGEKTVYHHIMYVRNAGEFKDGMCICVVQNEDTMDIWALAETQQDDIVLPDGRHLPNWTYVEAYLSLEQYYYDTYGWNFQNMTKTAFIANCCFPFFS